MKIFSDCRSTDGANVVGIDLAWKHIGLVELVKDNDQEFALTKSTCISLDSCSSFKTAYESFQFAIDEIETYLHNADYVFIEYGFGSQSATAAKSLGLSWGLVFAAINMWTMVKVYGISPFQTKKWAGSNNKKDVARKVKDRILALKNEKNEHILDAAAIVLTAQDGADYLELQ